MTVPRRPGRVIFMGNHRSDDRRFKKVSVRYKGWLGDDAPCLLLPMAVEASVAFLIRKGAEIVAVNGRHPPKGSDGSCLFDHEGGGPIWKSDL